MLSLHENVRGGHELPQGDPAIAGRDALMPVWRKTFLGQAPNRPCEQTPIEEASARQHNLSFIEAPTDCDHRFNQSVMEASGYDTALHSRAHIGEQRPKERAPIQDGGFITLAIDPNWIGVRGFMSFGA